MSERLTNSVLTQAAQKYGTPLFLYDAIGIKERYTSIRSLLSTACDIFYSMKANPAIEICRYFQFLGAGCEVSSEFELLTALEAGFLSKNIIFVGPAKKKETILTAIKNNIRYIVCESIEEIELVNVLSKTLNQKTSILIRINPDFIVQDAPIKMSGVATQFGIDLDNFKKQIKKITQCKNISIEGLQVYNASRVLSEEAIIKNIKSIFMLSDNISNEMGVNFKTVDFGGGFGVPYFENEKSLNTNTLILEINQVIDFYQKKYPQTKCIMELGRFLISESGCFLTRVLSIKKSHEKNFVIVDGGMHCYMGATGVGSFVHRNFPMRHLSINEHHKNPLMETYQIVGPLCTPGDVLLKNITLPKIHIDDYIILEKTGAYGLTASPGRFLSHGSPPEIFFENQHYRLIRRRETIQDILSTQINLEE